MSKDVKEKIKSDDTANSVKNQNNHYNIKKQALGPNSKRGR